MIVEPRRFIQEQHNPEVVAPRVSLPGCSLTKMLKIKKNLNMLLSTQGKRSNPLLANLLAKPSTAGPASGGKGQPKRKAKAPPASDGPDSAPDGAPPSTPDRRAPPGHPNGTPIGIVVEKVVARSSFAKASRRSTAAGPTAGTRASKAPTHEGTLVPSPGLVPNGGADGLASAPEVLVAGEDVAEDTVEDSLPRILASNPSPSRAISTCVAGQNPARPRMARREFQVPSGAQGSLAMQTLMSNRT